MKQSHIYGGFISAFILIALVSCSTVPRSDIYSSSVKEDNSPRIENIEHSLVLLRKTVLQRKTRDAAETASVKQELDALLSLPSSDPSYLSRLYALYADWYLLNRDKAAAQKMLKSAQNCNADDEYVLLVSSRLIVKNEEKQSFLENAVKHNPDFYRLKGELASLYFSAENYTAALALFDTSLDFLPPAYTELYAEQRDQAAKFHELGGAVHKDSARIIERDAILLSDMTALTQDNSHALDFITGTERRAVKLLAEQLKKEGWYAPDADLGGGSAKRKDAALFLWHMIAGGDFALLNRYSTKYMQRGKSPLEDVELDRIYFDSILGVIEEDIIPLIDGRRFTPEGSVSGLDFYNWLKKADRLRR
ncbi:hypothetical protein V1L52_02565 [Treponema sp. HNW]|uniref:tetratricopeptide repeat protein n=1 Tax=Treponema sp. HNW TaxID=3116654 RepID=UPI003D0DA05F